MCVQSLGQEDPLEKQMATHSWKIPWTEEGYSPWGHKEWDLRHRLKRWSTAETLLQYSDFVCVCVFFFSCDFLDCKDHSLSSSIDSEHEVQY